MKTELDALLKSKEGEALIAELVKAQTAELVKSNEELVKSSEDLAKSIAKFEAQETERLEKGAGELFKSLSFLKEEDQEAFVKGVVDNHESDFVATLIKHLESAQDEIATIKKEALGSVGAEPVVQDEVTKGEKKTSDLKKHLASKYADKEFL